MTLEKMQRLIGLAHLLREWAALPEEGLTAEEKALLGEAAKELDEYAALLLTLR